MMQERVLPNEMGGRGEKLGHRKCTAGKYGGVNNLAEIERGRRTGLRAKSGDMAGQTGPKTRWGKSVSSQNARKHGMRSRKLIVGDERQEDFDQLAAGWRAEYEPEGQAAESLMERVILNDWLLRRGERCHLDAEWELAELQASEAAAEEIEKQHQKVQLYLRYKTTAERSFYRAFYAVRGLRKDKVREELDVEKFRKEIQRMAREEAAIADREAQQEKAAGKGRAVAAQGGAAKGNRKKRGGEVVTMERWLEVGGGGGGATRLDTGRKAGDS